MSKTIEVPEGLFAHLDSAAVAAGLTPRIWVDEKLPEETNCRSSDSNGEPKTLADLFAGRVGLFSSGNGEPRLETLRG